MSSKFFFFADPSKLTSQEPTDAFGPVAASGGTDFRVSDRHALASGVTSAPAVAVCGGTLCAQYDGQGTLTLILKPTEKPPFEAPAVEYFIYRRVAKSSLISGSGAAAQILDPADTNATAFTKRIAAKVSKTGPLAGSYPTLGLDRDAAFKHTDGTLVFRDDDPLARLFNYPHKDGPLPTVSAGEVIGAFEVGCTFEIVLRRLGYMPKLKEVRKNDNVITVSLPAGNGLPDEYDTFAHWHAKEQVLAYLDPAAYFGAFVQAKLYKVTSSGASKVKGRDLYNDILKPTFDNKNAAWLDIRNNLGFSYNLFGLYGDTLRFVSPHDATQTASSNFRSSNWPLLKLARADLKGAIRGGLLRTKLGLPTGASVDPCVLVSKGFVTNLGPERPEDRTPAIVQDLSNVAYYKAFPIALPATSDGGQDVLTPSYTRINYYEKQHGGWQPATPLNIVADEFVDGVFRVRELKLDTDYAGKALRFEIYPEEVLVDLDDRNGPTYAACVGIAEDVGAVTLFAFPAVYLPNANGPKKRPRLPGWTDAEPGDSKDFLSYLARAFRYVEIEKKSFLPGDETQNYDMLFARHRPSIYFNAVADDSAIEHYVMLAFQKAASDDFYANLLAEIAADAGADPALPAVLTASELKTFQNSTQSDQYYEQASMQCAGFAKSGTLAVRHDTALSQKLYQYGGSLLSARRQTAYDDDNSFEPLTAFGGDDVPQFGLVFDVIERTYKGDQFAFDSCNDPSSLIPRHAFDPNLLNCRYERLFRYDTKSATPLYYMVPWMGIPGAKGSSWLFAANKFKLTVTCANLLADLAAADEAARKRKLTLKPSHLTIKAVWATHLDPTADTDTLAAEDINTFVPRSTTFSTHVVRIEIADGVHGEFDEYIDIQDVPPDNSTAKTVGRVRILFLDFLKPKVIFLQVTDDGTDFVIDRILKPPGLSGSPTTVPDSLESDDGGANHANALDDVDTFGLNQIGIHLEMEDNAACPYKTGSAGAEPMFEAGGSARPFKIAKTLIVPAAADPVTAQGQAQKFVETFSDSILYVQDSAGAKHSKHSCLFVLFSEFPVRDTTGIHTGVALTKESYDKPKLSLSVPSGTAPNILFLSSTSLISAGIYQATGETFAHEGAHAMFVNHFFDDLGVKSAPSSASGPEKTVLFWSTFLAASVFFNVCTRTNPVSSKDMLEKYDDNSVGISSFETAGGRTLHDDIVSQGMEVAIKSFIDTKIFPGAARPAPWTDAEAIKAGSTMPLSDLLVWISLNDMVKFTKFATNNIMDYRKSRTLEPNATNGKDYFERRIVHFNRFQWELVRKSIRRMSELVYTP